MPYRALLTTIVTVALALLAVGMWVRAVAPLLSQAKAATMPAATLAAIPSTQSNPATDTKALTTVIKGTLLLCFILICMLLVVGIFATFREWVRVRTVDKPLRQSKKTKYVDAWKLAAERMKEDDDPK